MKKNYLLLNFIVLLFSMTFGGYALQPTAADIYTPTVTGNEVSVFLETPLTNNIKVYAWIDKNTVFTEGYPGDKMTLMGTNADGTANIYKWTYNGDKKGVPAGVIFTENENKIGGDDDKEFKNHGYYVNGIYSKTISNVSQKTFTLLSNGADVSSNTTGSFVMDLTKKGTADATIKFSIDSKDYGLATAKTISNAGTTSGIAFTTDGKEALTLKAGLIYYLSVTEDGKMTVVAKEKGVADRNYYLVGNFFEEDGDNINYDKKYFRFTNSKGDGTLTFDIPASLSIKAQVYGADGKCYGPVNGESLISNTNPSATEVPVKGDLGAGDKYWTFKDRGLAQTGIYTITINVDAAGTPTKWEVKYDNSKRMAYFLVNPTEDYDAVVHPAYAVVNADRSCNNNFYGNIYLEAGQHCFVVGNITSKNADDGTIGNPLKTTSKLYLQGNGGYDPTTGISGSERDNYTKVCPNRTTGFTYDKTKTIVLEYNPARGNYDIASQSGNYGICGEILEANKQFTDKQDPITSVQIVGNGVVGSWELSAAENMTYNKKLDCWEYTFTTEKPENADNKFRFIANRSWKYNWGEDSTEPSKQARTPYTDTTKPGREASLKEPNELGFTKNGTERGGDGTYGDMIFNRPAGVWTIRLYIRTLETEDGNGYVDRHAYTITGSESKEIYRLYRYCPWMRGMATSQISCNNGIDKKASHVPL